MPIKRVSDPNNHKLPDELQKCLKELVDKCVREDEWVRKQQVKLWKKNDEFWHGVQYIFWSESKQEWISPASAQWFEQEEGREGAEGPFYDYVVNIYKAHGESIIAALSAQIPAVRFPPDDADDADDISTSKTYDKVVELIERHNSSKITLLRALLTLWNQGIVFAYHPPVTDKKFGEVDIPQYEEGFSCGTCGPQSAQDGLKGQEGEESPTCPICNSPMKPELQVIGHEKSPKSRVCITMYDGLHVKVPYYVTDQKESGYLICTTDQPRAKLKYDYPHVADKLEESMSSAGQFEKVNRTPSSYSSASYEIENLSLLPLQRTWLRPWQFENLGKEKAAQKDKLQELFPDGCYVAFVGDIYIESRNENLDDYWTIGKAGLAQYIHADPLGQSLISINEIQNVLTNITLETIEQGIPSTFADTDTLNFEVYSSHEARPGTVYPVHSKNGKPISASFYETGRASLSREVPMFADRLDKIGQFTSGSFPSLFGGPSEGKTRTAAEYNMSHQMALQRLSIAWTYLTHFWTQMMSKCVKIYVDNMIGDERFTQRKEGTSNYINVWIRKAEMTGHVGEVEAEGSESFPMSMPQKQALLMQLIQMNNQFLTAAAFDSNNRSQLADLLGFPDFYIPGEDQRIKQVTEIQQMAQSGQTIEVEPLIDDDTIHANVTRHWLIGPDGQDAKLNNPQVYAAISQHLQAHVQSEAQKTMQQTAQTPPGQSPDATPGVD